MVLLFLGSENQGFVNSRSNSSITNSSSINITSDLMTGTFELHSSDNFENYLAEMGVNYFLRQLAMLAQPVVTISRNCSCPTEDPLCLWIIETDAGIKSHQLSFKLGEKIPDTTLDGREIVSMFHLEGPT